MFLQLREPLFSCESCVDHIIRRPEHSLDRQNAIEVESGPAGPRTSHSPAVSAGAAGTAFAGGGGRVGAPLPRSWTGLTPRSLRALAGLAAIPQLRRLSLTLEGAAVEPGGRRERLGIVRPAAA